MATRSSQFDEPYSKYVASSPAAGSPCTFGSPATQLRSPQPDVLMLVGWLIAMPGSEGPTVSSQGRRGGFESWRLMKLGRAILVAPRVVRAPRKLIWGS